MPLNLFKRRCISKHEKRVDTEMHFLKLFHVKIPQLSHPHFFEKCFYLKFCVVCSTSPRWAHIISGNFALFPLLQLTPSEEAFLRNYAGVVHSQMSQLPQHNIDQGKTGTRTCCTRSVKTQICSWWCCFLFHCQICHCQNCHSIVVL